MAEIHRNYGEPTGVITRLTQKFPEIYTCTYSILCYNVVWDKRTEVPGQDFGRTSPMWPLTQQSEDQDCTVMENCEDQQ